MEDDEIWDYWFQMVRIWWRGELECGGSCWLSDIGSGLMGNFNFDEWFEYWRERR